MEMEASHPAVKTSELLLSEKQAVSHGSPQRSPSRNARPVFVPKQPPRPRQRGALPREPDEQAAFTQHAGASMPSLAQHISASLVNAQTTSSSSQQQASLKHSMPSTEEAWKGKFPTQHGMVHPQQRGSSRKKKNPAPSLQRGNFPNAEKFSRSWHRVTPQEPPHQRVVVPPALEKRCRPRQRGAIGPPQAFQVPFAHTPSSSPLLVAMEPRVFPPFLQLKSSFSEMWLQLEGAIESRERMLMDMKAEMEKSLSQVKIFKDDALKEREEVEARKAGVIESLEITRKQTGKVKSAREGLERISTDLSVQVAELNHLLQEVQEQQRVLTVLESLKDHRDASNDENSFMNKNLQECEVKLATMERELAGSKQASELLEKSALQRIGDLQDGSGLPFSLANNASSKLSVVQSTLQISTDTTENFSKTKMDTRPSGLNGDQDVLGHAAALKRPKLEAVS